MKRIFRLYLVFFKVNWMQEIEFRVNFAVNSMMSVGWILSFLLFTQIIFGRMNAIAGWTKPEVVLLVITQAFSWSLLMISAIPGMDKLSEKIKRGDLDQLLTKPVSARLLLAIGSQNADGLLQIPLLFIMISILSKNNSPLILMSYLLLVMLGSFILYNVFFMIHTTAFWLTDLFNIGHLIESLASTGKLPPTIFKEKVRVVLCYLVPTVFIAAIPTRVLLGDPILPSLLLSTVVAIITFVISQMFWNFALRHYSSASS
ncbi:MAG: ABC-2 family transporter protein [Candidatus Amesbacteria bacterium]|nr:ABC-2 family transporter protein [Candidatus Amesbacteria bacterium]